MLAISPDLFVKRVSVAKNSGEASRFANWEAPEPPRRESYAPFYRSLPETECVGSRLVGDVRGRERDRRSA